MFSTAIVRPPGAAFEEALTTADLGQPDVALAIDQHAAYCAALRKCGLDIIELPPDDLPDSTFVEDVAICTPECAVLTRPGAPSRTAEVESMRPIIEAYFDQVFELQEPGTLDGGDVLEADGTFYIGLSERTNEEGSRQLLDILGAFDYGGSVLEFPQFLHLKSGVSYLGRDTMLVCPQFNHIIEFRSFRRIVIQDPREAYAANAIWVNGKVLVSSGYDDVASMIKQAGFETIELDMSEFEKADGGLSCLSLRF